MKTWLHLHIVAIYWPQPLYSYGFFISAPVKRGFHQIPPNLFVIAYNNGIYILYVAESGSHSGAFTRDKWNSGIQLNHLDVFPVLK